MTSPTVARTIGINTLHGLGYILNIELAADMGDNGRVSPPLSIELEDVTIRFSYYNKKTGNVIYREVEHALQ